MGLRDAERVWAQSLPPRRARHYLWSRRWMRAVLAELFAMPPEAVPLNAPPGQAPFLEDPWGFVSISHCPDALVVAWAPWRIGVDLEQSNRAIPAAALVKRFFCSQERDALSGMGAEPLRQAVLHHWLLKEAAIKWQRGSLAKDLAFWCCDPQLDRLVHQRDGAVVKGHCWQQGVWSLALVADEADVGVDGNSMRPTTTCLI